MDGVDGEGVDEGQDTECVAGGGFLGGEGL